MGDNTAPAFDALQTALESDPGCDSRLCVLPSLLCPDGRSLARTCDLDQGIDFVYPDTERLLSHGAEFGRHAIITTTNFEVDNFTRTLVARMGLVLGDGLLHEFLSSDSVEDDPANRSLSDDYLDGLPRQNGIPPHRLQLFEGAMCMLMRNLDPKRGLAPTVRDDVAPYVMTRLCDAETVWDCAGLDCAGAAAAPVMESLYHPP
jgi:hypothetical protein